MSVNESSGRNVLAVCACMQRTDATTTTNAPAPLTICLKLLLKTCLFILYLDKEAIKVVTLKFCEAGLGFEGVPR